MKKEFIFYVYLCLFNNLEAGTINNITYVNNIVKSPNDKNHYRGLILPNQLQVLLISDPDVGKSAAAMSVSVGHLSDPKDLPGLAHFLEHLLFMGTKKYPSENEYKRFILEHGGNMCNAMTSNNKTLYLFNVAPEHLKMALDIFAQMFISPLLTESAVEREVNAVNLEFDLNLSDDQMRLDQLRRSFSKKGHPYNTFPIGSKKTLATIPHSKNIDVRKELINFFEKWYSANIMTLIVLGNQSLEELQEMVVPIFSEIENKNVVYPEETGHPFNPDILRRKAYVVPVNPDGKLLVISFPISISDYGRFYKAKPITYIEILINNRGPKSLISVLKAKNWIKGFSVSTDVTDANGFDFFEIIAHLTNEGMENVDEIITLVFQYLNLLRESATQNWIFEELKTIAEMNFRFENNRDTFDTFLELSRRLDHDHPLSESLTGARLIEEYRPDIINMTLSEYLKPSNVLVIIFGKKYEAIADEVEQWFGTKYKLEKIPDDVIQKWENCGINSELALPSRNQYLPSNFDILFKGEKNSGPRHPLIIHENNFIRVWFKQDDQFLLPQANLKLEMISPVVLLDAFNYSLMEIFVELLKAALDDLTYGAKKAGLSYDILETYDGFTLNIYGFNDKQDILLDIILEGMENLTVDSQKFNVIKETSIADIKYLNASEPYVQFSNYLNLLLKDRVWSNEERLEAMSQIKVENLTEFIPRFFSKAFVECLIVGNVNEARAHSLIQIMERRLISKIQEPLLPIQLSQIREIKLNDGEHYVYEVSNKFHKSSCIGNYYQCCALSTENNLLMDLLWQILKEPSFEILRTKEQLGYAVQINVQRMNTVQGLKILVQSDRHPDFVDQRIEAFLVTMRDKIDNMTNVEFERHKEALAFKRSEEPQRLSQLASKFWDEISSRRYNFNRDKIIEVADLRTIRKIDIIKFFDDYIKEGGPKRRKLSIHIISQAEGGAGTLPQTELKPPENHSESLLPTKIQNIALFKSSHQLYPLTEPSVDIANFRSSGRMKNTTLE